MKKLRTIVITLLAIAIACFLVGVFLAERKAPHEMESQKAQAQPAPPSTPVAPAVSPQVYRNAPKPGLKDPEARDALALVGADQDAEKYWVLAINNPDLPPNERQDLIEDLNEEGFVNRKNPTAQDLALIEQRIKIIEELMPFAMDDVNAAAFKEAYKDLNNMLGRTKPR